MKAISASPTQVQLSLGRFNIVKCLAGDMLESVAEIRSGEDISVADSLTIKELEDFITTCRYKLDTIEARFLSFKQNIESEMSSLFAKLSKQEKIITTSKQQLCKLRKENLNLKSRI